MIVLDVRMIMNSYLDMNRHGLVETFQPASHPEPPLAGPQHTEFEFGPTDNSRNADLDKPDINT